VSRKGLSLRAHAFVFALIRAATIGVSFLATIFLVRMLRISDYGYFAAATGIFNLTFAFGYFGLDQLYLSGKMNVAELRRRLFQLSGLVSLGSAVIAALWPALITTERLLVLLLGLAGGMEILRGAWLLNPQKAGRYPARAWRELGGKFVVLLGSCVGAALLHTGIAAGAGALMASTALSAGLLVTRQLPLRTALPPQRVDLWSRLRAGLPYGLSNVLFTIYFSADMALLGSLAPPEQAAYYRVAYGFVGAAVSIALAVNNEVYRPQIYGMATSTVAGREVRG
jgi:O-antigen/teichoic acid export membrane protein